ncbi:hypothetical protein Drose_01555 [Dactylosporangium roseum]|uniref:Methylase-associated X1 domain-containing protein n=1 Tax=Dactylosporangium roseum TaxID=47989 RepID=A0ABY5Z5U6_9ACTN|nr:hypothetical protein [Dactylosporangium roseum]UWZ37039.1 hypothetical protein Drose_01555 [Dactylosporangium roseum]
MADTVAGRSYARVYRTLKKDDLHRYLTDAVERSGGRLLYASAPNRAPVFLGVETPGGERIGVMVYPFRATHNKIKNRPQDEHRLQIRLGEDKSWKQVHPLGRDVGLVDTTLVLGIHLEADLFVGLDANLYDPLPMGISVEFKQAHVDATQRPSGWHVFERDNVSGSQRPTPRAPQGLETVVLFKPDRLLDFVRLERKASDLGLDSALRFATAQAATTPDSTTARTVATVHDLEEQFEMTAAEIMEVISNRSRLAVAVRGGVAEHHLGRALEADPNVAAYTPLDKDGQHDFDVVLQDGRTVRVECKNASPTVYRNGDMKVEVQKTRATQNDPAGRLYRHDQFDIVAACLFAPTGQWRFVYRSTSLLTRHPRYDDRLAPVQRITDGWSTGVLGATESLG